MSIKNWCVLSSLFLATQVSCSADSGEGSDVSGDLSRGATGEEVVSLRAYLKQYGYFPNETLREAHPDWQPMLPETSGNPAYFDEDLESALTKFQRNMGLEPSGVVDAATAEAMAKPRCGFPDDDPDASGVDKWSLISGANKWTKTAIKYKINQPNVALLGMGTKEATKAAILSGFQAWQATTNLTFTEVTSGQDLLVDYINIPGAIAQGNAPPNQFLNINSTVTFTAVSLRMAVAHEVGHVLASITRRTSSPT